jgi:hypothetical protein
MLDAVFRWATEKPWPETTTREPRLRLTDQAVVDRARLTSLSVSSDRIAIVA